MNRTVTCSVIVMLPSLRPKVWCVLTWSFCFKKATFVSALSRNLSHCHGHLCVYQRGACIVQGSSWQHGLVRPSGRVDLARVAAPEGFVPALLCPMAPARACTCCISCPQEEKWHTYFQVCGNTPTLSCWNRSQSACNSFPDRAEDNSEGYGIS